MTFCAYDKPDNVGGPVSWLRRLLPLLRERDIDARCLFIMHWGETGPAISPLIDGGFSCRRTSADRTEDRVRWILDELRDDPPDIFVPNLVVAGYFAARWVRAAGIPTVGILHSDDEFYSGIQDEFVFGAKEQLLAAIVCVSQQLDLDVASRHPRGTIVRRIPYGIAMPAAKGARDSGKLHLAFVGRLAEEQKRITDVVKALGRVVTEVPGTDAIIIGDGPDREAVERLLASDLAGLDIRLAGRMDSDEVQRQLSRVDVIVLLSDYEGLPIALLEAMACGCVPVCLRGRSGISELVDDDVTGLLVSDRGDGFVRAIRRLATEPGLWSRLSDAARERAAEYSDEASADAWVSLFRELAERAGNRSPIATPRSLSLPRVHPGLASADVRIAPKPSLAARSLSRARMKLGRWRRAAVAKARWGPRT
ncbi:MAG: glycosyltransferase family 4 protein [Gemmatimonadales bacterium]